MVNFVNEKFLANINQLALHNPSIQLVIEHFVAAEKNLCEHVLDDWVPTCTLLVKGVKNLTSSFALLLNFKHQVEQSGEHLKVNSKLLLE